MVTWNEKTIRLWIKHMKLIWNSQSDWEKFGKTKRIYSKCQRVFVGRTESIKKTLLKEENLNVRNEENTRKWDDGSRWNRLEMQV